MDLRTAADYLGVSERYIRRLVFERRITYYKHHPGRAGRLLFERGELDAYLQSIRVEATA